MKERTKERVIERNIEGMKEKIKNTKRVKERKR